MEFFFFLVIDGVLILELEGIVCLGGVVCIGNFNLVLIYGEWNDCCWVRGLGMVLLKVGWVCIWEVLFEGKLIDSMIFWVVCGCVDICSIFICWVICWERWFVEVRSLFIVL